MIRIVEEQGRRRPSASIKETSGPVRVVTDDPDPNFKPRPAGFTAQLEPVEDVNQIREIEEST